MAMEMNEMVLQEEMKSAIKHEGNYFIMDSEQLVCNPFQDLQSEAMSEAQKKASLTEKLTSVKNNVCENHFTMERAQLERNKTKILKQLHDNSSKLRYEAKLLDLDRQKHSIEVKKRVLPERDYSYDDMQICNTEKRLGANIASFYLERKMKYPMRLKSVSDISTTPLVRRARQALKLQDQGKECAHSGDRVPTARSFVSSSAGVPTTAASPMRPIQLQRRSSRSAPLVVKRANSPRENEEDAHLPAIADNHHECRTSKPGHVKFMFEDPIKILTMDDPMKPVLYKDRESGGIITLQSRPYTYHPGMEQNRDRLQSRDFFLDTSDDDDDPSLPDHVDLRALLFDKESSQEELNPPTKSVAQSSHVPTPILRRYNTHAPKITQDLIQQENNQVQSKVDRFLQELHTIQQDDSDSDIEEDMFTKARSPRSSTAPVPKLPPAKITRSATTVANEDTTAAATTTTTVPAKPKTEEPKTPRTPKDAWKYIKGRDGDGSLRGNYSAEDLVLQTMTGVPLSRSLTAGIPLHSAGRAIRHTATFKMRKVVDKLINDRTKYQQHEIEELKRRMDQGMDLAAAAASLAAAPTPAAGPEGLARRQSSVGGMAGMSRRQSRVDSMRSISQEVRG